MVVETGEGGEGTRLVHASRLLQQFVRTTGNTGAQRWAKVPLLLLLCTRYLVPVLPALVLTLDEGTHTYEVGMHYVPGITDQLRAV